MNTVISVSQLNRYVKSLLEGDPLLNGLFLRGEISNFKDHYRTGHLYMTLKDENAEVQAVMFRSAALSLRFTPENGMRVIVRCRVSLYDKSGSYQVYIDEMQPDGVGGLQIAYEQLKNRLAEEGLFEENRKRPIPRFPRTIGVITSPTGAAVRDILNVLGRRYPLATIVFSPVQVQGKDAAPQLAKALHEFDALLDTKSLHTPDVLIIGRGGGSIEDLWAFNEEIVARAVAACRIPVISAVGHETDFTICDFVADLRAPTPSAAAELAVPDRMALLAFTEDRHRAIRQAVQAQLLGKRRKLDALAEKRCLTSPLFYVEQRAQRLDYMTRALTGALRLTLTGAHRRLATTSGKLDALSPLKVLSRGYALVSRNDTAVRETAQVTVGDSLTLRLTDGRIGCRVETIEKEENGNGNEKNDL